MISTVTTTTTEISIWQILGFVIALIILFLIIVWMVMRHKKKNQGI
ncbi:MAG: hypothetical protein QMD61_04045 [Methanobacterium sp.]|nr:hypothetical protein [Methanobacterium sp.]